MKLEKINDNQIRCTLTREDLDDRQLKLSELAYGTEKAKSLFHEMMQQAAYELGFEATDMPLMIEAIPLSADTILLIITKVEYPEELDTRFSKFSEPSEDYDNDDMSGTAVISEAADDILDLFGQAAASQTKADDAKDFVPLNETISQNAKKKRASAENAPVRVPMELSKLFVFHDLETIEQLSTILSGFYDEYNTLYRKPSSNRYCLIVRKGHHTPEAFNKVCNILSEYSHQEKYLPTTEAFMNEHYDTLIPAHALQTLSEL